MPQLLHPLVDFNEPLVDEAADQTTNQKIQPEVAFSWSNAKTSANHLLTQSTGRHLSDLESVVLQGSWQGKTYEELAALYGYSVEYLNKDVGNKLWKKLSEATGERITKKNFKEALQRIWQEQLGATICLPIPSQSINKPLECLFPEGAVTLNSPLYIEREGVEKFCYETVLHPGSLIRIKAPKLMGKTSLMNRILAYAKDKGFYTVYLSLDSVDRIVFSSLDRFLRWLCLVTSRQLNLENQVENFWNTDILGSNDNCTAYFEECLLAQVDRPIVLGLDDVDRLFPYLEIIEDFLGMLRSWHEKAKIFNIWQHLRLVVVHSTEVYIPLDINQSPFNAGVPIELQEFDVQQIEALAHLHQLNWVSFQAQKLISMVGGHPYLVRLALYEIGSRNLTLKQLMQDAPTEAGIYSSHLRRHLEILQQAPDLAQAIKQVVTSPTCIELDSMQIYKLHSMGLVQRKGNHVRPSCWLYREYFRRALT